MSEVTLRATERGRERPNALRRAGMIPAILYGPTVDNLALAVKEHEFLQLLNRGVLRTPIKLELTNGRSHSVMVKEVQKDPVKGNVLHVDFLAVAENRPITATVPLEIDGEEAVAQIGGIVQHQMREVGVECLPKDLPEAITVDVSRLKIGDTLTVAQLTPPPGVELTEDPESIVLTIVHARSVEEEETTTAEGTGQESV